MGIATAARRPGVEPISAGSPSLKYHTPLNRSFCKSLYALSECTERVNRLTEQIQILLPQWHMFPVAQALQTLRGVSLIVATTTIAELGDLTRFASPVELMSYLGLVPSEHSSG